MASALREAAKKADLPLYGFVEDVAASGGYAVAVAATPGLLYAHPSSILGSIGVVSGGVGITGMMEKIGLERRVKTAGKRKLLGDAMSPETEEGKRIQQKLMDGIHEIFIDHVKEYRGDLLMPEHADNEEKDLFQGDVWLGAQAKKAGLIDELGELRPVMQEKFGENVKLVSLKKGFGPVQQLFEGELFDGIFHGPAVD